MSVENAKYTTRRYECLKCGHRTKRLDWNYDSPPLCICEGTPEMAPEDGWSKGESAGVIGDETDVTLKHVLPGRRFTSKSELKREMEARGYTNHVEHIGSKGSDKNPHTTRWT